MTYNYVYEVTIMMIKMIIIIIIMLLVCGPVHTVWCDSVGFNDKLLFPCSSKAFSSITYGFQWDDSDVSK